MRRMRWMLVTVAIAVTGLTAAAPAMGAALPSKTAMSISGRVTDQASGTGVPGMCVEVDANLGRGVADVAQATTDANGYYRTNFKQTTGTQSYYDVSARPDCGAHGWWQVVSYPGSVILTSKPGQNTASGIDMATAAAGRIRGRIVDNSKGAPLAGMQVFANDSSASPAGHGGAITAADGSYVIGALDPGQYKVVVYDTKNANPPQYLTVWVPQQPTASTATAFAVAAGQDSY